MKISKLESLLNRVLYIDLFGEFNFITALYLHIVDLVEHCLTIVIKTKLCLILCYGPGKKKQLVLLIHFCSFPDSERLGKALLIQAKMAQNERNLTRKNKLKKINKKWSAENRRYLKLNPAK